MKWNNVQTPSAFLRGVTLVELMVVVSIVAILLSVSIPSLKSMNANNTASRLINELKLDIGFARSQAISLSTTIQIIPINGSWSNGWRVLQGATELRSRGSTSNPIADSGVISSTDYNSGTPITFDNRGRAQSTGSLTLHVPYCSGNKVFKLSINQIGQLIQQESACP